MSDRWRATEGRTVYNIDDLRPGMLIAVDAPGYRHKPWRIHEIRERRDDRLPLIIRPDGAQFDFAQYDCTRTKKEPSDRSPSKSPTSTHAPLASK